MLFGLQESTTIAAVEEMHVPAHLAESFEGIAALGNMQVEKLYEEVLNVQGAFTAKLQQGISTGRLDEACIEIIQEGALGNFITKIKDLFKKLWAAIKALFTKFMAWLDSKIKSDKDFIAKYKKTLLQKASEVSDMDYKGHKWEMGDLPGVEKVAAKVEEQVEKATEVLALGWNGKMQNKSSLLPAPTDPKDGGDGDAAPKKVPGVAMSNRVPHGSMDSDDVIDIKFEEAAKDGSDREELIEKGIIEISKALGLGSIKESSEVVAEYREKLYGGEAETLTGPKVSELIKLVEEFSKDKSAAEKAWKAYEKSFNEIVKKFERKEKEFNSNKENANKVDLSFSTEIAVAKEQATLANQLAGVYVTALKDRRNEARSILAKVITYKKSK